MQAAHAPAQRVRAVFRRDPGKQAETQPDDGVGIGAERGHLPHGVAHQQAVVGRERQEGRRDACHGGIQTGKAAALDQQGKPAGQSGMREALHQFGERARPARPERHVERSVESLRDADASAAPFGVPDEQLRPKRRRERACFRRRGQARRRVVGRRHRAPVPGGRLGAVQQPAKCDGRGIGAERFRHDPGLGKEGREAIEIRLVPGCQPLGGEIRALGLGGVGQPKAQPLGKPLATAFQLVRGQHRGAGPGSHHKALGGHQRRQPPASLGDHVAQRQPEPLALTQGSRSGRRDQPVRLVRRALEHHMQCVARSGEYPVEAPRTKFDEAVEFPGAHHRARAVEPEQRDQRAVPAGHRARPAG